MKAWTTIAAMIMAAAAMAQGVVDVHSHIITPAHREMILHENAERLFNLNDTEPTHISNQATQQ